MGITQSVSQHPVFVVGFPRSGTTLLQSLLITQDELVSFPETHFFLSVLPLLECRGNTITSVDPAMVSVVKEKLDIEFSDAYKTRVLSGIKSASYTVKSLFEDIVSECLKKQGMPIGSRWVEKTPYHGIYIDRIFDFYPNAHVVHIVRNPLHSILSWKRNRLTDEEISIEQLSKNWIKYVDAIAHFTSRFESRIISVRYEDLVKETEKQMTRIFDFIAVYYDVNTLFHFNRGGHKIIHEWEHWKRNNLKSDIMDMNQKYPDNELATPEMENAKRILKKRMSDFGYE